MSLVAKLVSLNKEIDSLDNTEVHPIKLDAVQFNPGTHLISIHRFMVLFPLFLTSSPSLWHSSRRVFGMNTRAQ